MHDMHNSPDSIHTIQWVLITFHEKLKFRKFSKRVPISLTWHEHFTWIYFYTLARNIKLFNSNIIHVFFLEP